MGRPRATGSDLAGFCSSQPRLSGRSLSKPSQALSFLTVSGFLLSCSACVNNPYLVNQDREPVGGSVASRPVIVRGSDELLPSREATPMATASPGVVRLRKPATANNIQQMSHSATTVQAASASKIEVCPPEPRTPIAGCDPYGVGMPFCEAGCQPSPHHYPDEYLCDGGDRGLPVHYTRYERYGLETEDTVGEYLDHNGKEQMRPSSKVCIYAPRFAQVRTVSQPYEEQGSNEIAGLESQSRNGSVATRLGATASQRNVMADGLRMRSRAGGLESEQLGVLVTQLRGPTVHETLINAFQDLSFVRAGYLDQSDAARLQDGLQASVAWSRDQSPVISAQTTVPVEGLFTISSNVITVIDDEKAHEPGELRLVKLADKKSAQRGDIVTFTIRYDNLGPREVHEVRIVDNLTPRLEYVDDSATSDRAGRLAVADNGEGSLVLTWELTETLPAYKGGVVTFQARVR